MVGYVGVIMYIFICGIFIKLFNFYLLKVEDINMFYRLLNFFNMFNVLKKNLF